MAGGCWFRVHGRPDLDLSEPGGHNGHTVAVPTDALTVEPIDFDHPDAVALVARAVVELRRRYGTTDEDMGRRVPDATDFAPPLGFFLVARVGGAPAGCAGLHPLGATTAEVKRLYVADECRRSGVGRRLMGELERRAAGVGHRTLYLETGVAQPEAIALYRADGWTEIPGWPGAPAHVGSVYFEKAIAP